MRIVEIREQTTPIASPMRNAVIDFSRMDVSLVAVVTDRVVDGTQVVGYGFNSNGRYAQPGLLRERFIPRLLDDPDALLDEEGLLDPWRVRSVLMRNEKPGGHGERSVAVGILDMAIWDALAKAQELPLAVCLARRIHDREPAREVPVYAAGGYYYPEGDLESLRREMRGYLELGYTSVKMKIGGAALDEDLRRIEAVIDVVGDPARVAVDANGRFALSEALAYAAALEPLGLMWYEEPVDPLDYRSLAVVAEHFGGVLATGENLFSHQDAVNLSRHGGLRPDRDVMQLDPALSYGVVEYLTSLARLGQAGWSPARQVPHGGHNLNLALGAALGLGAVESYPGVFEPFGGFGDDEPIVDGRARWSDAPGLGLEEKRGLLPLLRELAADVG